MIDGATRSARWPFCTLFACALALGGCGDDEASPTSSSSGAGAAGAATGSGGGGGEPGVGGGGAGGAGGTGGIDPALAAELQATLEAAFPDAESPGAVVAVRFPDGQTWLGAMGVSDLDQMTPMTPDGIFHIGSITKTFVTSVTMRLIEDGQLSLDDTLDTWAPTFPGAAGISLRHLLSHTSGIYNYTDDPQFWADLDVDPAKVWAPDELVAYGAAQPPLFAPGADWSYSNTNFVLVGQIVEAVTGTQAPELIETNVTAPLALANTQLSLTNADVPEALVHGYHNDIEATLAYDVSAAWTAGGMASSAEELAHFASALFDEEVVDAASLAAMSTGSDVSGPAGYGLGLMSVDTSLGEAWGHTGGIWGFTSLMLHMPDADISVVGLVNASSGDPVPLVLPILDALAD